MNTNLQDYSNKRYNILSGEWVLVSPHWAKRPWQGHMSFYPPLLSSATVKKI